MRGPYATVPNLLSAARLLLAPVTVWLVLEGRLREAFWVLVVAGVSDAVDGWIARHCHAASELGAYLDAIADKVLIASTYLSLALRQHLPWWLTALVLLRDVLIVLGATTLHIDPRTERIPASWASKVNTAAQIALAALVLLLEGPGEGVVGGIVVALIATVVVTIAISIAGYARLWMRRKRSARAAND